MAFTNSAFSPSATESWHFSANGTSDVLLRILWCFFFGNRFFGWPSCVDVPLSGISSAVKGLCFTFTSRRGLTYPSRYIFGSYRALGITFHPFFTEIIAFCKNPLQWSFWLNLFLRHPPCCFSVCCRLYTVSRLPYAPFRSFLIVPPVQTNLWRRMIHLTADSADCNSVDYGKQVHAREQQGCLVM